MNYFSNRFDLFGFLYYICTPNHTNQCFLFVFLYCQGFRRFDSHRWMRTWMLDLWGWLKTLGKLAVLAGQSAGMRWGNDTWNRMKHNETTWKPWNEVYSIINYVISYIINYIILKPPKTLENTAISHIWGIRSSRWFLRIHSPRWPFGPKFLGMGPGSSCDTLW